MITYFTSAFNNATEIQIKLKVHKDVADMQRDANCQDLLQFLNSTFDWSASKKDSLEQLRCHIFLIIPRSVLCYAWAMDFDTSNEWHHYMWSWKYIQASKPSAHGVPVDHGCMITYPMFLTKFVRHKLLLMLAQISLLRSLLPLLIPLWRYYPPLSPHGFHRKRRTHHGPQGLRLPLFRSFRTLTTQETAHSIPETTLHLPIELPPTHSSSASLFFLRLLLTIHFFHF